MSRPLRPWWYRSEKGSETYRAVRTRVCEYTIEGIFDGSLICTSARMGLKGREATINEYHIRTLVLCRLSCGKALSQR